LLPDFEPLFEPDLLPDFERLFEPLHEPLFEPLAWQPGFALQSGVSGRYFGFSGLHGGLTGAQRGGGGGLHVPPASAIPPRPRTVGTANTAAAPSPRRRSACRREAS
jgi:hypothetical protein